MNVYYVHIVHSESIRTTSLVLGHFDPAFSVFLCFCIMLSPFVQHSSAEISPEFSQPPSAASAGSSAELSQFTVSAEALCESSQLSD